MSETIKAGDTVRFEDDDMARSWGWSPGAQYRVESVDEDGYFTLAAGQGELEAAALGDWHPSSFEVVTRAADAAPVAHACPQCGQAVPEPEPTPTERSYVVDFGGMVTVHDDGTVTLGVDLVAIDTVLGAEDVPADQAEADSNQLRLALGRMSRVDGSATITRTLTPEV